MQSLSSNKRVRDSDESVADSVDAKRILLDILDESDICTVSQDLDSFMKSFQDEISPAPEVVDGKTSESGDSTESRPELGFLLGASDDELGLPPSDANTSSTELADSVELSELWGLDDQISFEYEFGYGDNISSYNNGEYVALDGLFDYTDLGFGSWPPGTLPAQ
ncbi:hypothetical protein L1987_79230 [Smallanthus sonchifolius]|uniref:Uncharacterized protein n=1 Tax=Smallanthus sonchifolius TaxID=185202 RepID=A0ACB8ZFY2_9ASTR|nr:hypothetical protein L1987_79230 [Smallanthus sonchifolius]